SAITFMAIPAKVYATDWQYFPLAITILVITLPIIRYYLPFFRSLQTASAYQYLELRFNYLTRFIASSLFIVFMVARMALVLYLPSLALSTVIGINIYMCIAMLGVVTMIYSAMGGIKAVIWSDVIQGFLLLGGAILALGFLIFNTEDGLSGFIDTATQFDKFKMIDWNVDFTRTSLLVVVIGGLSMNLISYSSDQTVIQRYMTTDSTASARKSILFNGILSVIISVVFYLIGTALFTFYKTNPQSATYTLTNSDAIFPFYIISQLPTGIAGIIIAAIFAASMSTISSNINSISTAFTIDIFSRYAKNNTKEKSLITARIASVVAGVAGILLALSMASWNIISLFDYFSTILGLFASGLGGLFLLGIFYGSVGAKGALTGFILSTISVIVISQLTNISFLLYGAIGLLLSILIGLITSWMLKEEHSKIGLTWNEFKKAKREGKLS
ncbi:MAG: sodium/solute symporter, partial [Rikenellaceae bacterium]